MTTWAELTLALRTSYADQVDHGIERPTAQFVFGFNCIDEEQSTYTPIYYASIATRDGNTAIQLPITVDVAIEDATDLIDEATAKLRPQGIALAWHGCPVDGAVMSPYILILDVPSTDALRAAVNACNTAEGAYDEARDRRDQEIVKARGAGVSAMEIAGVTGLAIQRVYQILA